MSTAFMATNSAEMDPTLHDDTEMANQICLLVVTQGDGTPLCPTFFNKEDAVKLCVGLGQEHPEGVLQLLDTEIVLTFWFKPEMMAAMHHLALAVAWHGEPIKLCIWPPNEYAHKGLHCCKD